MNKDQHDHTYVLDAAGLPDLKLQGKREIKVAGNRRQQADDHKFGGEHGKAGRRQQQDGRYLGSGFRHLP